MKADTILREAHYLMQEIELPARLLRVIPPRLGCATATLTNIHPLVPSHARRQWTLTSEPFSFIERLRHSFPLANLNGLPSAS